MFGAWSGWAPIDAVPYYKEYAAYEIRMVRNGKPIPIKRWCGTDRTGIVCIGGGNLKVKWDFFYYAAIRKVRVPHSAGRLYSILMQSTKLRGKIGDHQFEIRYRPVKSKNEGEKLEAILSKKYLMKFGEMPPLNSTIPSKVWEL